MLILGCQTTWLTAPAVGRGGGGPANVKIIAPPFMFHPSPRHQSPSVKFNVKFVSSDFFVRPPVSEGECERVNHFVGLTLVAFPSFAVALSEPNIPIAQNINLAFVGVSN